MAIEFGDHLSVWTDGIMDPYPLAGVSVAGAGAYLPARELAMQGATWGEVEEYGDSRLERCCVFMPIPGPLKVVQGRVWWHYHGHASFLAWVFGR